MTKKREKQIQAMRDSGMSDAQIEAAFAANPAPAAPKKAPATKKQRKPPVDTSRALEQMRERLRAIGRGDRDAGMGARRGSGRFL